MPESVTLGDYMCRRTVYEIGSWTLSHLSFLNKPNIANSLPAPAKQGRWKQTRHKGRYLEFCVKFRGCGGVGAME